MHIGFIFIMEKKVTIDVTKGTTTEAKVFRNWSALRKELKRILNRKHALRPRASDPDLEEDKDDSSDQSVTPSNANACVRALMLILEQNPAIIKKTKEFLIDNMACNDDVDMMNNTHKALNACSRFARRCS